MKAVLQRAWTYCNTKRASSVALILAGMLALAGGAAVATRTASDHIASAAFSKLAPDGDSSKVLDTIADKVVEKITEKGGTLDSAQSDLVNKLAGMAGKKLGKVDPATLIAGVRADVVSAGLGKLNGISTDKIVSQVTSALIAQAQKQLSSVDVEALAKAAINDVIKNLDLDKLVKEKIDSVDINAVVSQAIAKQLGGSSSSGSGGLNWLSLLGGSR